MKRFICVVTGLVMAGALFAVGSSGGSAGSSGSGTSASASPSKTPTALDLYAIALKSDYAEAYNMLGFCTRKQGNVAKAFTYYETALKLKPNFPEAREYYGEAFLQQGNLARAVQQYVILQKAGSKFASELLDEIDAFVNQKG
jgi:tetratricopeptide (TPR) repeat protein